MIDQKKSRKPSDPIELKGLSPEEFLRQAEKIIRFEKSHTSLAGSHDQDQDQTKDQPTFQVSSLISLALDGVVEDDLLAALEDQGEDAAIIKFPQEGS